MEKVTAVGSLTHVWVMVNHTMSTQLQNKVKDLTLIFFRFECLIAVTTFLLTSSLHRR